MVDRDVISDAYALVHQPLRLAELSPASRTPPDKIWPLKKESLSQADLQQPPLRTPVHHPSDPPHLDLLDRVRA